MKERENFEDVGIDLSIILKRIINNECMEWFHLVQEGGLMTCEQ